MQARALTGRRLKGSTAVVTGAGAGIGRAIALAYMREGANVALFDRDPDSALGVQQEAAVEGFMGRSFECDVSRPAEIDRALSAVRDAFGGIDVLVNNAGIFRTSPLVDLSLAEWNRVIATNLTGVFLMTRAVVPAMIERGSGKIINVASQLALRGAPNMAHYCAAKAGVLGLTRALAHELIPFGILVNAIAPGPTLTTMLASSSEQTLAALREELPIGRFAKPEEIAATAVMLASGDGDYYVGATLNVSGGHVM